MAKKSGPGYVYLIHATGTPHYKIGHAVNVVRRLWQVNHCNPNLCVLIHAIPVDCQTEAESWWHRMYQERNVKGEWFELTAREIELFSLCKGGTVNNMQYEVFKTHRDLFAEVMDTQMEEYKASRKQGQG